MNERLAAGWPFTRRELVAVVLGFLLTLPLVTTRIYASDEVQYFAWLRSLAFDRDVDFENEYQHFHDAGAPFGALSGAGPTHYTIVPTLPAAIAIANLDFITPAA